MSSKRYLGFDFGMKRIGIACGQTLTKTATPLCTLKAKDGVPVWQDLDKLIKEWLPNGLVVGIPTKMDGEPQAITYAAKSFAKKLEKRYQLPVYCEDERLTTKAARQIAEEHPLYDPSGEVDALSAGLILESWLNK